MTVKIKLRENNKATVKCDSATHKVQEMQWFVALMRSIRDGDPKTHPAISIKNKNGEIPKLPPPKIVPQEGTPPIPPEILEKMKKEKKIPQEGTPPIPPEILEKMKKEKEIKLNVKKQVKKA